MVEDSVYSVGIAIMTYYSVVAISSVVYFWRTAFRSWRTAMGQVILPGIGALVLIPVGILEAYHMAEPETGSGASLLGVGTVVRRRRTRPGPGCGPDDPVEPQGPGLLPR